MNVRLVLIIVMIMRFVQTQTIVLIVPVMMAIQEMVLFIVQVEFI